MGRSARDDRYMGDPLEMKSGEAFFLLIVLLPCEGMGATLGKNCICAARRLPRRIASFIILLYGASALCGMGSHENMGICKTDWKKHDKISKIELDWFKSNQSQGLAVADMYYFLLIELERENFISVGRLGDYTFAPGFYVYVGRAKRNMEARIARHLRREKKKRWHIDYLTCAASNVQYQTLPAWTGSECELAGMVKNRGGKVVVKGFGSSDCKCAAHLFYFIEKTDVFGREYIFSPPLANA